MRMSDWSSDVCSSDLGDTVRRLLSPVADLFRGVADLIGGGRHRFGLQSIIPALVEQEKRADDDDDQHGEADQQAAATPAAFDHRGVRGLRGRRIRRLGRAGFGYAVAVVRHGMSLLVAGRLTDTTRPVVPDSVRFPNGRFKPETNEMAILTCALPSFS